MWNFRQVICRENIKRKDNNRNKYALSQLRGCAKTNLEHTFLSKESVVWLIHLYKEQITYLSKFSLLSKLQLNQMYLKSLMLNLNNEFTTVFVTFLWGGVYSYRHLVMIEGILELDLFISVSGGWLPGDRMIQYCWWADSLWDYLFDTWSLCKLCLDFRLIGYLFWTWPDYFM